MTEVLEVAIRQWRGTSRARRARASGQVPAVLYGHGKPNVWLTIPVDQIEAAIRHGAHFVELKGEVQESALIKEVQWDTYGAEVLHVDLTRAEASERVEVTVPVELKGEAPGTKEGGMVQHHLHEAEIICPATAIPEKLTLNINALELDGTLRARDLRLPPGAELVTDPDEVVVHCVPVAAAAAPEEEEEVVPTGAAEPEVIGRKAEEEEEAKED